MRLPSWPLVMAMVYCLHRIRHRLPSCMSYAAPL
nr:MAG TPA: hypothetical protein [Caudoviricetes sp.]